MFLDARRVREITDYGLFEEVVEPTATLTLEESQAFVSEIERLLQKKLS